MATGQHSGSTPPTHGDDPAGANNPRRSKRAHEAILTAAAALLNERSYSDVCIEAIAARAGVGKQTIYRWWPSKAAVLMEACAAHVAREIPLPDRGSLREDLRDYLSHVCAFFTSQLSAPALAGLLAEAQCDKELAQAFRERLLIQRRTVLSLILERGVVRGEIRADADVGLILDMVHGAIWYRMLFVKAPLDEAFVDKLIDQLMTGFAVPESPAAKAAAR